MQNQARNLVIVALIAALVVVACWKQSPGQGEPSKLAAVIWEYRVDRVDATTLNKLASEGWEVCAAFGGNNVSGGAILRRPKDRK